MKLTTPELKGAFSRGKKAAKNGETRRANPYRPVTDGDLWRAWNSGFADRGKSKWARQYERRRQAIIELHGSICWLCHKPIAPPQRLTLDHVVPKSKGGRRSRENLRPAHFKCNQKRGNGPPPELLLTSDMVLR